MSTRKVEVHKNWRVRPDVGERESVLFFNVMGTKVGAMYTPIACASKIESGSKVKFYYIAICELVTLPPVKQYVSVEFDCENGKAGNPVVTTLGPEKVDFELAF